MEGQPLCMGDFCVSYRHKDHYLLSFSRHKVYWYELIGCKGMTKSNPRSSWIAINENYMYERQPKHRSPPAFMVPMIASFHEEACSNGHLQGDMPIQSTTRIPVHMRGAGSETCQIGPGS
jgi:hypothetical protein